jgi:hypothetical protein
MPVKLSTTINSISSVPNPANSTIIREFHQYMKSIGTSESYQNGNLKIMIYFARFLGPSTDFHSIQKTDRTQLYFKGKWMDVGLKQIEQLSLYGTALLIIEKKGVAEQLRIFADQKGIALLNTRGFLTEYAEILSKKSEKEGCKVAILSDFDASGLVLAGKTPNCYGLFCSCIGTSKCSPYLLTLNISLSLMFFFLKFSEISTVSSILLPSTDSIISPFRSPA